MKLISLTVLLTLTGLSTAQAQTTYWLPTQKMTDSGRMYAYDTKAPDYVAEWLQRKTPIGGGSIVTKTVKGEQRQFIKQTFSWSKPLKDSVNIETVLSGGYGGGKWEYSADLKNQAGVIAALKSHVIQSSATHEKAQILALIQEGDTPPGLVFTDSMVPYDASSEGRLYAYAGSPPEIVAVPNADGSVDVAWQDYSVETASGAAARTLYIHRLRKGGQEKLLVEQVIKIAATGNAEPKSLGLLAGFTKDDKGNFYLLTAADEKEPGDTGFVHRKNILNLIKLDNAGRFQWQTDLNVNGKVLQPIYAPMNAGTARLAFGTIKGVDLIFVDYMECDGDYDRRINRRHQHSDWCIVDAETGDVPKVEGLSATFGRGTHGHSFDIRVIFDPTAEQFVATEASDASFSVTIDQPLQSGHQYQKDGVTAAISNFQRGLRPGSNDHYMELGGVANVRDGYLVLASRQSSGNVPYDLFAKQMPRNFWEKYVKDMSSWNQELEGAPKRLTNESGGAKAGAVRPKLVKVGEDEFIILFERWRDGAYESTQAMKIGADGGVRMPPKQLTGDPRLQRGDDAFALSVDGKTCAAWVTGEPGALVMHKVFPDNLEHIAATYILEGASPHLIDWAGATGREQMLTKDTGTPTASKDLNELLLGTYSRLPMINDWHNVSIRKNDQGKLVWTDAAGHSWPLEVSGNDVKCDTAENYGKLKIGVSVDSNGQVTSVTFRDEPYVVLSLEKLKADLIGRYERDPVLNDYHRVSIQKNAQGDLTWTNDAGKVWNLEFYDAEITCDTGESYGKVPVGLRLSETGEVTSVIFNNEPYVRK